MVTALNLGERLEKIKEKHEQGLIDSKQFLKQLLELAKDMVEAEQQVDPEEEQDKAKAALTELFMEVKTEDTPVMSVSITRATSAAVAAPIETKSAVSNNAVCTAPSSTLIVSVCPSTSI